MYFNLSIAVINSRERDLGLTEDATRSGSVGKGTNSNTRTHTDCMITPAEGEGRGGSLQERRGVAVEPVFGGRFTGNRRRVCVCVVVVGAGGGVCFEPS